MKILAESGSTKCDWLLISEAGVRRIRTQGINAVRHSVEQIREVLAALPRCEEVEHVRFYGAGCGEAFSAASERLRRELAARFGGADTEVASDLTAAARALFGRGEGIACILGTGSNSCHCRGGEAVDSVPPLGYVLGDEGSGAALGRALLNGVFKGHIPLRGELLAACGMSYEQIIGRVYCEPFAGRFLASLAPFVLAHADVPQVRTMVLRCFGEFAERNLYRYPAGLPVGFVGGVAAHFEPLLREAMEARGRRVVRIVESPVEELLKYHDGERT